MQLVVAADPALAAAAHLADAIAAAIDARGRCVLALSGGRTPWAALRALRARVDWPRVDIVQVDERAAPEGHPDRNLTGLRDALPSDACIHPMPVDDPDAAARYAASLRALSGDPPAIDVVHLGLGDDGHTASLVPGDPVLDATEPVAWTAPYRGRRRLTMTYPTLDAARSVVWLVGAGKAAMIERLVAGDASIPAGRVRAARQVLITGEAK